MSQQTTRRIVIGDVHGHYEGLMNLLDAVAPGEQDQVYLLGDLIDRGPQSCQVIEFVKNSSYQCLLGNHEHLLLEAFPNGQVYAPALQAWLQSGGRATVSSYVNVELLVEHVQWIRTLPTYLDLGDVWLVHAGVNPELPIEKQGYAEFCWIRDEFHRSAQPYFSDKMIITGHTITFTFQGVVPGTIARGQGWLGIDTGAYHPKSGWLTALDVDNAIVHQVNVYTNQVRKLRLDEITTEIEPQKRGWRQALKM
jgi:serine/threonine protein phosphatase 1